MRLLLRLLFSAPLMSYIAREHQDYRTHKTDKSDCVLIARLAIELHCYIPEERGPKHRPGGAVRPVPIPPVRAPPLRPAACLWGARSLRTCELQR